THDFFSSSYSKSGGSVTPRKFHFPPLPLSGVRATPLATCRRRVALTLFSTLSPPHWKRRRTGSSPPPPALIATAGSRGGVLASGDCAQLPLSPMRARARPFAPIPFTNSSSLSVSARDSLPASSASRRRTLTISAGRSRRYSPLLNFSAIGLKNGTPPPPCST